MARKIPIRALKRKSGRALKALRVKRGELHMVGEDGASVVVRRPVRLYALLTDEEATDGGRTFPRSEPSPTRPGILGARRSFVAES